MEINIIIQIAILIFSVIIHEVAHGLVAYQLGDPTAKYAGRLTLNPLKHLDPLGSFFIPLLLLLFNAPFLIGWAKPVPYNPYNLSNQKYGPAIVGVAGPLSNLVLAIIAAVSLRAMLVIGDGVTESFALSILAQFIFTNILLLVFNLIPIPPLDGSKLLFTFLPLSEYTKSTLEQYGFVFIILFMRFFGAIVSFVMIPVLGFFNDYVVGADNALWGILIGLGLVG